MGWLSTILWIAIALFLLLLALFIRNSFFGYALERFDPGNVDSLRRLAAMKKFRLSPEQAQQIRAAGNPIAEAILWLSSLGYTEAGRRTMGLVFERPVRKLWPFGRQRFERVFLLYLPMPNVLIVDRLLRDCIAYIDQQSETRPAPHNHLFLITDMNHKDEVTSAASGVVNFLLKIDLGSLCPWLLDITFGRLFYPLDRSLIKPAQRRRQNSFRSSLLQWLTKADRVEQHPQSQFAAEPWAGEPVQPSVVMRAPVINGDMMSEEIDLQTIEGEVETAGETETTAETEGEAEAIEIDLQTAEKEKEIEVKEEEEVTVEAEAEIEAEAEAEEEKGAEIEAEGTPQSGRVTLTAEEETETENRNEAANSNH